MLRNVLLVISLLCFAILMGCSKTDNTNSTAGNGNKATSTTSNTSSTSSTSSTASSDKVGIAECDDFIAKYDACVSGKVPEASRAQLKSAEDQWRKAWKQAADNPATRATLAAQCKQASDQQNAAMKAYGCSF